MPSIRINLALSMQNWHGQCSIPSSKETQSKTRDGESLACIRISGVPTQPRVDGGSFRRQRLLEECHLLMPHHERRLLGGPADGILGADDPAPLPSGAGRVER